MFLRNASAVVVVLAAAAVIAEPVRIRSIIPTAGLGMLENPKGDGMVKLQFVESVPEFNGLPGIRAHVHLHTFRPNTTYGIVLDCVTGFVDVANAVTTNAGGNANWVVLMPCNGGPPDPVNSAIIVYRETVADNEYTATEERAMGIPQ